MKYNLTVVRSSRKSISLSVSTENKITLRCPRNASDKTISSFIERKKQWLERVIKENEAKLSVNRPIIEFKEIYVYGKRLPLIVSDKNVITCHAVCVKDLKYIKQTFVAHFSEDFIGYAKNVSGQTGLNANGFFIKAYKSRWGCCDRNGKITFNYLLFMLPPELQRYVIIHELCHTVYFNHSAKFWQLVKKFEPNYANLRKQLKSFDFITNLY